MDPLILGHHMAGDANRLRDLAAVADILGLLSKDGSRNEQCCRRHYCHKRFSHVQITVCESFQIAGPTGISP